MRIMKSIVSLGVAFIIVLTGGVADADVCLMTYPDSGPAYYHYSASEYYTVGPGDPLYDPIYDRGGEVLIEVITNEIAYDIYQAPGLSGFVLDEANQGIFFMGHDFNIIVDGWSPVPTTYVNILLVFEPDPDFCVPSITVDGNPVLFDPGLGYYYPIGDLTVSTPTPDGLNFSDTVTHAISWDLCIGVTIWAFADEDYDLVRDAEECFSAFSHDATVPTRETTWGGIKSLYGE